MRSAQARRQKILTRKEMRSELRESVNYVAEPEKYWRYGTTYFNFTTVDDKGV